jgi:hypothetical protein
VLLGKTAGPFERLMWCAAPAAGCCKNPSAHRQRSFVPQPPPAAFSKIIRRLYVRTHSHTNNRLLFNLALAAAPTHTCADTISQFKSNTAERASEMVFIHSAHRPEYSLFSLGVVICDLVLCCWAKPDPFVRASQPHTLLFMQIQPSGSKAERL